MEGSSFLSFYRTLLEFAKTVMKMGKFCTKKEIHSGCLRCCTFFWQIRGRVLSSSSSRRLYV